MTVILCVTENSVVILYKYVKIPYRRMSILDSHHWRLDFMRRMCCVWKLQRKYSLTYIFPLVFLLGRKQGNGALASSENKLLLPDSTCVTTAPVNGWSTCPFYSLLASSWEEICCLPLYLYFYCLACFWSYCFTRIRSWLCCCLCTKVALVTSYLFC